MSSNPLRYGADVKKYGAEYTARWCNHYHCEDCDESWEDEWACQCDDECPTCGIDYSPNESDYIGPYWIEVCNQAGDVVEHRGPYESEGEAKAAKCAMRDRKRCEVIEDEEVTTS